MRLGHFGLAPLAPMLLFAQLLPAADIDWVAPLGNSMPIPQWTLMLAAAGIVFAVGVLWTRERRLTAQPQKMRRLYKLGEAVVSGHTPIANLNLLRGALPGLLGVTWVHIYLHDRASGALRSVEGGAGATPILPESPVGFREKAVVLCFRNRSLIFIPDSHRSPFFEPGESLPRSAMFVPMLAQRDVAGVLELSHGERVRWFSDDEQAVAQHLANQTAIGMRLREQTSMWEHVAAGARDDTTREFISLNAQELREVLFRIGTSRQPSRDEQPGFSAGVERSGLSPELEKAEDLLSKILKFTEVSEDEPRAADAVSLLRDVVKCLQVGWEQLGIEFSASLPGRQKILVAAGATYLDEVLVSLFRKAEELLKGSAEKILHVRMICMAGTMHLEISCSGAWPELPGADPFESQRQSAGDALSLSVCRGFLRGLGGDLTLSKDSKNGLRFEVELPLAYPEETLDNAPAGGRRHAAPLTTLIVHPDDNGRQALLLLLGEAGHRSVPAAGVDEAVDLVKRMPFHVLFCSAFLPGRPWLECFERTRGHVGAFVLLTRGPDPALSSVLPAGEAFTLAEPVRAEELGRLLEGLPSRIGGL